MARTKLTSPQLNPSKTTDANGWTVYNYGTYKMYAKTVNGTGGSQTAGTAWFIVNSGNLPTGKAVNTLYITYSLRVTGSAHGLDHNFEMANNASVFSITARNDAGSTIDYGTPEIQLIAIDR